MSQMFETDIASLLPDDHDNVATHTHLLKTIKSLQALRERVTQLEQDQLRLLDLIEKMVEMDKLRAQSFDLLYARVAQLERLEEERHNGRAATIGEILARISEIEREFGVPLDGRPVPFPGQDDDFGLAPRSQKEVRNG